MTSNQFQIKPVNTSTERKIFLDVPEIVYRNDPNWVAPLRESVAKQLAEDNPFSQYGEFQAFIALSQPSGEPLGRIVAAINRRLLDREAEKVGLFGYFECVEDFEVARSLFEMACQWLRDRGMTVVRGPIDLSTHNNCLFLVDGFDSPPVMMMPYNPRYYPEFVERAGWQKAKDAYAYSLPLDKPLDYKYEKGYNIARKSGVTFRNLRTKGDAFEEDVRGLYHLFTTAFSHNWSSSSRTEEEFMAEAKDLQQLADPDIFIIAEDKGKMVGLFMCLPNYNIALKHVNGRLNLWGILKFLWYRRKIKTTRTIAIGSLPEYRRKMVSLGLIYLGMKGGTEKKKPYVWSELSWVWEDNSPSRKIIEATGAKIYKTYRVYEKEL
ncbi:hypothetical protein [Spirulina sp. 06S082]|uniref:hypothetical protein n=1 Tax=Spirulina sp. 06S082 TaxID=3110248 RepID=UPI002B1FAA8F|nr:hypothetical protein [Spirulina sp. 06S082]MEA5471053.1 hypothetical protein [Spirulina sp. 06S082]